MTLECATLATVRARVSYLSRSKDVNKTVFKKQKKKKVLIPIETKKINMHSLANLQSSSLIVSTRAAAASKRNRATRHRAGMSRTVVVACEPGDAETFTAPMLQNVRQKVKGFETTMAVTKLPADDTPANERKPMAGDLVSVVFSAQTEDGELLQSMEDMEEPITFEVGAADVMGNPLFLAFDKAVQGMVIGEEALVSASGGEYNPNLLFKVPMSHPEVRRLEEELDQPGKGGLHPGATVALSNGNAAVIRDVDTDAETVILDANHPFAGSDLQFAVKLVTIEDKPDADQVEEGVEA